MKRLQNLEVAAALVFFTACGWLIFDIVASAPQAPPELWPLVPMFAAIVLYVGIEHLRSKNI